MDGLHNNVSFGSLTARNNSVQRHYTIDFKDLTIEDLDLDHDGEVSAEELQTVIRSGDVDIVELSTTDAEADMKVTEEQFILWQQSEEIDNLVKMYIEQAAKDLAGASSEDIKNFADKFTDFANTFKNDYLADKTNDISKLVIAFKEVIPEKYNEIKKDVLSNTKSAVKARVISKVIEKFMREDGVNGSLFAKKIDKSSTKLSSNAQRLLTNVLISEAEKFTKSYTGNNYEKDLNKCLEKFLKTSDKDKLAEAIGIWDKEVEEVQQEKQPSEQEALLKFKKKAKQLLLTALENNIFIKIGEITVRSEMAIMPAIAQFRDSDTLRWAVNKAINELSKKTKFQEIIELDKEQSQSSISPRQTYTQQNDLIFVNENEINFFE